MKTGNLLYICNTGNLWYICNTDNLWYICNTGNLLYICNTGNLWYICNTGNLCPSRYSNRVEAAERGTVACTCLEFQLVHRLLYFIYNCFGTFWIFSPCSCLSCTMDIHCPIAVKSAKRQPHTKTSTHTHTQSCPSFTSFPKVGAAFSGWVELRVPGGSSGWIQWLINYKIQINISLTLSCLAKEQCIPVNKHFKSLGKQKMW